MFAIFISTGSGMGSDCILRNMKLEMHGCQMFI